MKRLQNGDSPKLISIKEASEMLNIHPNTLRRWDNLGLLKAIRMGSRKDRSYSMDEIIKFTSRKDLFSNGNENVYSGRASLSSYTEENDAAKRLDQVLLTSGALAQLLTVKDVINFISNHIAGFVGAQRAIVFTVNETGEYLEIASSYDVSENTIRKNSKIPLNEPLPTVSALKYGQAIFVESAAEMRDRFPSVFESEALISRQGQAYAALPLQTSSQKFGVIGISFKDPQRFSKDDISFMTYLAGKYALALERAVFYENQKQEKNDLERSKNLLADINTAALEFLSPLTLEETYATIVDEAKRISGADFGSIYLLEGDRLNRVYASNNILFKIKSRKRGDTYRTFKTRKTRVYIVKPENDPHPMLYKLGVKSALRIPICYKNKSFGVVNMLFKSVIDLNGGELEIFQLFGSLAALALSKARKKS